MPNISPLNVRNSFGSYLSKIKVGFGESEFNIQNNPNRRLVTFPVETKISLYFEDGLICEYVAFNVDMTALSQTDWKFLEEMSVLAPLEGSSFVFSGISKFKIDCVCHSQEVFEDQMYDAATTLLTTKFRTKNDD